jgi:hypothetical protein
MNKMMNILQEFFELRFKEQIDVAISRTLMQNTLGVIGDATDKILKTEREKQKSKPPTTMSPISQAVTQPQVNMFAANQQAQTPSGQVQTPQGQPNSFTNIPQNQLDKYSTLFGKVV